MTMNSVQSTFPIALGLRITGVDDATFAQTGESYSTIALPNANSHTARTLQEDNTDLAYEFARKFPGYTAEKCPLPTRIILEHMCKVLGPSRTLPLPHQLGREGHPRSRGSPLLPCGS